jgi:hypothetical protein
MSFADDFFLIVGLTNCRILKVLMFPIDLRVAQLRMRIHNE